MRAGVMTNRSWFCYEAVKSQIHERGMPTLVAVTADLSTLMVPINLPQNQGLKIIFLVTANNYTRHSARGNKIVAPTH